MISLNCNKSEIFKKKIRCNTALCNQEGVTVTIVPSAVFLTEKPISALFNSYIV